MDDDDVDRERHAFIARLKALELADGDKTYKITFSVSVNAEINTEADTSAFIEEIVDMTEFNVEDKSDILRVKLMADRENSDYISITIIFETTTDEKIQTFMEQLIDAPYLETAIKIGFDLGILPDIENVKTKYQRIDQRIKGSMSSKSKCIRKEVKNKKKVQNTNRNRNRKKNRNKNKNKKGKNNDSNMFHNKEYLLDAMLYLYEQSTEESKYHLAEEFGIGSKDDICNGFGVEHTADIYVTTSDKSSSDNNDDDSKAMGIEYDRTDDGKITKKRVKSGSRKKKKRSSD